MEKYFLKPNYILLSGGTIFKCRGKEKLKLKDLKKVHQPKANQKEADTAL